MIPTIYIQQSLVGTVFEATVPNNCSFNYDVISLIGSLGLILSIDAHSLVWLNHDYDFGDEAKIEILAHNLSQYIEERTL